MVRITERGKELLSEHPQAIDLSLLARFPEFIAFRSKGREKDETGALTEARPNTIEVEVIPRQGSKPYCSGCGKRRAGFPNLDVPVGERIVAEFTPFLLTLIAERRTKKTGLSGFPHAI